MFTEKRDPRQGGYQGNCPWGEFHNQGPSTRTQVVNSLFKELVYHILEKSRMNLILSGLIRWAGNHPEGTRASIAITTRTEGILRRIAESCEITWTNWQGPRRSIGFYTSLQGSSVTQDLSFIRVALLGQHMAPSIWSWPDQGMVEPQALGLCL